MPKRAHEPQASQGMKLWDWLEPPGAALASWAGSNTRQSECRAMTVACLAGEIEIRAHAAHDGHIPRKVKFAGKTAFTPRLPKSAQCGCKC
jgi:hypothetical protein